MHDDDPHERFGPFYKACVGEVLQQHRCTRCSARETSEQISTRRLVNGFTGHVLVEPFDEVAIIELCRTVIGEDAVGDHLGLTALAECASTSLELRGGRHPI